MKRRREDEPILSLDSFLDIVTNVVGVLILVAVVTVLGAGQIGVPAGTGALRSPHPSATRMLFECDGEQVYFIDEAGITKRVSEEVRNGHSRFPEESLTSDSVVSFLKSHDAGDATYRVSAEVISEGLTWAFQRRQGISGERAEAAELPSSAFQRKLNELPPGGFVYFVVREDSFELFRKVQEIAKKRGFSVGWHPVVAGEPLRFSNRGSLGKRAQ